MANMNYIQLMSHIQDLVKTAITNAAVKEREPETREGESATVSTALSTADSSLSVELYRLFQHLPL